jgi:glutathione synthase/RimK-type ligase-like ATP-grasp enzyme
MIIVYGIAHDLQVRLMCARLEEKGAPYRFLNQLSIPTEAGYDICIDADGITGDLIFHGQPVSVSEISGAYARYVDFKNDTRINETLTSPRRDAINDEIAAQAMALLDALPALVINRPCDSVSNDVKPYQKAILRDVGFSTPETIFTSDTEELRAFAREYRHIVIKSASGMRSKVQRFDLETDDRLALLENYPAHFEQYVPGVDYRVHVVGERTFVTRVASDPANTDYRYRRPGTAPTEFFSDCLDGELLRKCVGVAQRLNLGVAGIDLRITEDQRCFCFEVNTSPAFAAYELRTGQQISAAVADELSSKQSCAQH